MKRDEWTFTYTASNLAAAAAAQRDFRDGRIAVWESKKLEVMTRIRESGITVTESMAHQLSNTGKYSVSTSSRRGAEIRIDSTLQDDLSECIEKIREHTALRNQYSAWVQVLSANAESRLDLDHDDWIFFFGK